MEAVVNSGRLNPHTLFLIEVLAGVVFRIWKEKVIYANADCMPLMQSF